MKPHTKKTLVIIIASLAVLAACDRASAVTWIAGADMAANEAPDGPQELINPNPTVPQWSYGTRSTILGTALTLFTPPEHGNDVGGYANLDGYAGDGQVRVNTGGTPIIMNLGFGPFDPIAPLVMNLHPGTTLLPVVRWTVPVTGTYSVSAFWDDIDNFVTTGSDGGSGNVVVNGVSVFGVSYGNGGGATMPTTNLNLNAGDFVDFVLGRNANVAHDNTAFNATIIGAPEPGRAMLLLLGCWAAMFRRKRSN